MLASFSSGSVRAIVAPDHEEPRLCMILAANESFRIRFFLHSAGVKTVCPAVRGGAAADLLGDAAHGVETSTPAPRPNRSTSS